MSRSIKDFTKNSECIDVEKFEIKQPELVGMN